MHLNLKQLQAFRAVMQQGSISRAAEELHVSQPAVSKLIVSLEESLNFALFRREKKRVVATDEAYIFLKEVDDTLNRFQRLRETAEGLQRTRSESIRVGAMAMVGLTILPQVIWEFHTAYPKANVSLQIRLSQNLVDLVAARELEVAISQASHEVAGVRTETLLTCRAVCVLPPRHPLSAQRHVSLADLAQEPLISLTDGTQVRDNVNRAFDAIGVKPCVATNVQLAMAACQFVRIGGGVTIVDPITANSPANRDLVIRPIREEIPVPIFLYTADGVEQPRHLQSFIAFCGQKFATLSV